jgi:hypothetical protein
LNLTEKELWRLTIREFLQLYQAYKNTFDLELTLRLSRTTYAQAEEQQMAQEEWF